MMARMTYVNAAVALAGLIAMPIVAVALLTPVPEPDATPAGVPIYPCEFEDGAGQDVCHWDAETRGNGEGKSFVKVGETFYYENA